MSLRFDPSLLPDPIALESLRDLTYQGRQAKPAITAEWYTPVLQFGAKGLVVTPTPTVIDIFGRFADVFTVDIPTGATQVAFDLLYSNFDPAKFIIAQGSEFVNINKIEYPRTFTNVRLPTILFTINQSSSLRQLTWWTYSESPFGGFWSGQMRWVYGPPPIPPPPPPLTGRAGVVPIIWDCAPIAWTLSSYTAGSLTLRLTYADYALDPTYTTLSVANAPRLLGTRRARYEEMPWISGWRPTLLRGGEIEVWVDAASGGIDQVELVLYCLKHKGR